MELTFLEAALTATAATAVVLVATLVLLFIADQIGDPGPLQVGDGRWSWSTVWCSNLGPEGVDLCGASTALYPWPPTSGLDSNSFVTFLCYSVIIDRKGATLWN